MIIILCWSSLLLCNLRQSKSIQIPLRSPRIPRAPAWVELVSVCLGVWAGNCRFILCFHLPDTIRFNNEMFFRSRIAMSSLVDVKIDVDGRGWCIWYTCVRVLRSIWSENMKILFEIIYLEVVVAYVIHSGAVSHISPSSLHSSLFVRACGCVCECVSVVLLPTSTRLEHTHIDETFFTHFHFICSFACSQMWHSLCVNWMHLRYPVPVAQRTSNRRKSVAQVFQSRIW